jgi:glutaredoxin
MGASMSSSGKLDPEIQRFVEGEVRLHQVVIWSKSRCGYCEATKGLFNKPEFGTIDVVSHELDRRPDGSQIQTFLKTVTGQSTVPSVWVNGSFIGGNSETQSLYRNGALLERLGIPK